MAGFKLMKTFAEHFKFINDSTLLGNYKTAKIGYNSSNESLDNNTPQFTYGKLK